MFKQIYQVFPGANYMDLCVYHFGYEEWDPLNSFGPAIRKHFLFHYLLSGKGVLHSINEKKAVTEYHLEGGQGFLLWPGNNYKFSADKKNPWKYVWVEFDGLKAREFILQAGMSHNRPVYIARNLDEREKMKNELLYIATNSNNPPLELMGHFYLFFSAFIASSSLRKETTGNSLRAHYIHEAIVFIEQNYQNEITVDEMAASCNLDRSYLGKIFKSELRTSPQDFIIRYRMDKACELMKITKHTIGEISAMVGYQNMFNFSRAFKKIIGQSPRDWRSKNKMG